MKPNLRTHHRDACAAPATRPGWWAAACATCCSASRQRTSMSPPTRRPSALPRSFPAPAWWARTSAWCWCARRRFSVEVATFRSDRDYTDGRRPAAVHFETDPRQDALRRDFTINGLMMDPETREVLDPSAAAPICSGASSAPSATRTLASARTTCACCAPSASRRGWGSQIEPATFDAIRRNHAAILRVSAERVRDELVRILTEGGARRGFELLDATGLLADLLPEVAAMKGVAAAARISPRRRRLGPHPAAAGATGPPHSDAGPGRAAARRRQAAHVSRGRAHPLRRPRGGRRQAGARAFCTRLRFSREETEQVEALVANHMRFADVPRMKREHPQALPAPAAFRRAPGTAPPGRPVEQPSPGKLRPGAGEATGVFRGAPAPAAPDLRGRPDRRRLRARSPILRDPDRRGGRPTGRLHQQPRGSDGAGAREVPDLKWGGPPGLPWFSPECKKADQEVRPTAYPRSATFRARLNTSTSIFFVSLPVDVFC